MRHKVKMLLASSAVAAFGAVAVVSERLDKIDKNLFDLHERSYAIAVDLGQPSNCSSA